VIKKYSYPASSVRSVPLIDGVKSPFIYVIVASPDAEDDSEQTAKAGVT